MSTYNYNSNPQGIAEIRSTNRDYGLSQIIEIIEEQIKLKKGRKIKVLEPGCGGGRNLSFLKKVFRDSIEVYGSDISNVSIKHAKDNIEGVFCVAKTVDDCFYEKFDLIIMLDILEHLDSFSEVRKTIELSRKNLEEKGVLFVSCPIEANKYSIMWIFSKMNFWDDLTLKYYGHILQFTGKEIEETVRKNFRNYDLNFGVHFLSQLDTLLFFYLPKQIINFIGGGDVVTSLRESNIILDKSKFSWRSIFLKIYSFVRFIFLYLGFYESVLRRKSNLGAMNIYIKCC